MMNDDKTGCYLAGRASTTHASSDEPNLQKGEWLPPRMRKDADISIPYSNPPTDKLMEFYAAWAENYDTDLIDTYGYMAPTDAVAGMMTQGLAADARILDAGCGTGQAGALLATAGFTHVDGADLSPKMREVAARLGVYNSPTNST